MLWFTKQERAMGKTASKTKPLLSARETAIVELLVDGRTNSEIGRTLGISPETVKTFIDRVRDKLGVRRRVDIVVWWLLHSAA
jgi:DNA-binding CsgD family transcriptional regulator